MEKHIVLATSQTAIENSSSSSLLLLPNVSEQGTAKQTSIIIEQEDGTEKHIVLATSQTAIENSSSSGE